MLLESELCYAHFTILCQLCTFSIHRDSTDIQPDISRDLIELEFDYDKDREIRSRLFAHYRDQKSLSDESFSEWLAETNANLIKDVDDFVNCSLGIDGRKYLFRGSHSNLIHPATVILGMQATDHGPTLDMIKRHIGGEHPNIRILTIESGTCKKSQVLEIFVKASRCRDLLVIVEQTEIINKRLLENLVSGLYERLCDKISDHIMIMFCMSGSWKPINHLFPISIMNRMKRTTFIVKDTSLVFNDIQRRLLENGELLFKLDPSLIRLIDTEFIERDASVMNIKYLYQYALFEHQTDRASLLTLPQEDLVRIFKKHPKLLTDLKGLASLSNQKRNINQMNPAAFASFCAEQIRRVQSYHRFLSDQLSHYFTLLRDETCETFPTDLLDIYCRLFDCDDLANVPEFVDSISKLSQFPVEALKKRLLKIQESRTKPSSYEKTKDVYNILVDFLKMMENNDDNRVIIKKLIDKLLKHAQYMKNPLGPLNESIYHYKSIRVQTRAIPTTTYHAMSDYTKTTAHFGTLYQVINSGPEEMNLNILFGDFQDHFKSSKRARRETEVNHSDANDIEEGLVKAIFLDLIDCMEFQGLIKLDKRRSNKGVLRRCVWL